MTIKEASDKLLMVGVAFQMMDIEDSSDNILKDVPEAVKIARKCMKQMDAIKRVVEGKE